MWYYINNNNQEGPADEAAMVQLISSRTLNAQTMVWSEGMADWQPIAQTQLAAYVPAAVAPSVSVTAAPKPVAALGRPALGHPGLGMAMTQAAAINPLLAAPKTGWKQILFSFEGRIPRSKFWIGLIIMGVINGVVAGVTISLSARMESAAPMIGYALVLIPLLWAVIALNVKRWHDRGKSGWFAIISFLPIISIWALIECGFLRGTVGPNQFGQDPG